MSINNVQLEAFIAEYKYDPHYEIVWWMVAGLLKGEILEKFFMLFEGAPRDLLGGRHQQVIMGCLNEAREQLNQQTVQRIEAELMQYFCFEMALDQTSFLSIALGSSGAFPEHLLLQGLTQFEDKKWKIIQTLGHRPFLSEEAYAALVAIFIASVSAGKDWMVMNAAADVLKYALPESAQMALVTILQSHNTSVELKCFAINLLGQQKIFLQSIGTALVCALKDKNATLRCAAVVALNRWGISYVLVFALQDTDAKVRQTARDLLCQETSLSEDTQKDLINALQDDSPNALCKCAVIDILGKQNTLIEYAYIALIAVIKDKKNTDQRCAAIDALGKQGMLTECARIVLIAALQDEQVRVQQAAVVVLSQQPTLPEQTQTALIAASQDKNADVQFRCAAIHVLSKQSTLTEPVRTALLVASQNKNAKVRQAAVMALGEQSAILENVPSFYAAVISALQDKNVKVRIEAIHALGKKQSALSENICAALIPLLQDKEAAVRCEAVRILKKGSELEEVQTAWMALLHDKDFNVRSEVVRVLSEQNSLLKKAQKASMAILRDSDADVRRAATLIWIEQSLLLEQSGALLTLITLSHNDVDTRIRKAAVCALGKQGSLSYPIEVALIAALQDENVKVRAEALCALNNYSESSENAKRALAAAFWRAARREADAVDALSRANLLSEKAVLSLINCLTLQIIYPLEFDYWIAPLLDTQLDQFYALLPSLTSEQMQSVYIHYLFPESCRRVAPLCIQNNRLYFYAQGRMQYTTTPMTAEQMTKITEAIRAAQALLKVHPLD